MKWTFSRESFLNSIIVMAVLALALKSTHAIVEALFEAEVISPRLLFWDDFSGLEPRGGMILLGYDIRAPWSPPEECLLSLSKKAGALAWITLAMLLGFGWTLIARLILYWT